MTTENLDNFIKIMTLNVNGFRGVASKTISEENCLMNMEQLKELIDKVIINKNDIIILQEIPHKVLNKEQRNWFYNQLHKKFEEVFQDYKILKPKNLINSLQCTVAICKKDSSWKQLTKDILKYDTKSSYGNKFVELQCEDPDIALLGVHMPPDNDMWKLLIQALENNDVAPYTYVIGDFNANEKRGTMSKKPKCIRNCGYNHLISNNIITCYSHNTSIDNIYIKSDFIINKDVIIKVLDTNFTDHALCLLEYSY